MAGYLKRLVSSLGAYQVADFVGKVFAILLLPVYTGKIPTAGYGVVETLMTMVILISIVIRFGMIESFLRFYYIDADPDRRDALARKAVLFLLASTTICCAILLIPATTMARLVTSLPVAGAYRIAILGVWAFTNLELAQAFLRVDERLRAYATVTLCNVGLTIASSLVLVVGLNLGVKGLLLGNYASSTVVLLGLWWSLRDRLRPRGRPAAAESFGTLFDFGLPTVPAEASVYALSVLDRQFIVHQQGPSAAGRYAIAIKVAGAVLFLVRAFQYAWPPLAYSVQDDAEAARLYGLVTTYYALVAGLLVAALSLEARFIIRFLAPHPGYYYAYRAVPWVCLGWAMYGLWVVLLVIAGRVQITRRNFPAALAGLIVNIALLLVLVPRLGIAGAGIALCGAYVAMLTVMHLLVRRAFPVAFEWGRLVHLSVVAGGIVVVGDLLLPTHGVAGLVSRAAAFAAIPCVLLATGFLHRAELDQVRRQLRFA